jgi:hypothetical protein
MFGNKGLRRIPGLRGILFLAFSIPAEWSSSVAARTQVPLTEFNELILKYVVIHERAVASVPPLQSSDDPALIQRKQQAIGDAIRKARPNAVPGEFFVPAVRVALLDLIRQELTGHEGASARETILGEGNPKSRESPATVNLTINAVYPAKAPLSTMPPSLLAVMPVLPEALEFRFVGRDLILRDTKANLIVDILKNAVPLN